MVHQWETGASGRARVDIAVEEHEGVVARAVGIQRRVPAGHHVRLVGAEETAVRLVPVPHVRGVSASPKSDIGQTVLLTPAAVGRVHDVQLSVRVLDRLRPLVDERIADSALPRLAGLGDDEAGARRLRGAAHPAEVDVLLDVGVALPAGPDEPPLVVEGEHGAVDRPFVVRQGQLGLGSVTRSGSVGTNDVHAMRGAGSGGEVDVEPVAVHDDIRGPDFAVALCVGPCLLCRRGG